MGETLFKKVDYTLSKIMDQIELGSLALPEIQRKFEWEDTKVRDLFDSMYRGYPVGFFLFWENGFQDEHRQIGEDQKQKVPSLLIVDGQQRLTSLYAVIKDVPVIRKNYKIEHIKIAFNPIKEKFEVLDAAIKKNPEYIPDISVIWNPSADIFEIVDEYTEKLEKARHTSGRELTKEDVKQIIHSIKDFFPF